MSITQRLLVPPGLRVLVTGGAAGIGAAIAEGFLEADARVYVCDIDARALDGFRQRHPDALGAVADVGREDAAAQAVNEAARALGGLDVLVNNAGIAGPTGGIDALDVADWDRSVATSVPGQSGQPGSPHYGDLLPLWADGKYFPLLFSREQVEKQSKNRLVLEPLTP